jgi:hypothetical protein
MTPFVPVTLPNGAWVGGEQRRAVRLRPVTDEDDGFLLATADGVTPAARVTGLLARCLEVDASIDDPLAFSASLTVGDREALLLHLRRLTFGDELECTLRCPAEGCGEALEIPIKARDLILPPYPDSRPEYELEGAEGDRTYRVRFRLPTGADQEMAAELAASDLEGAVRLLASRVVTSVQAGRRKMARDHLPAAVLEVLEEAIAEHDAQAQIELELTCPSCGGASSILFDTASYFFHELDARLERLLREVHLLAWYYHWGEGDIVALPQQRRRRYLDLITETLSPARQT